MDYVGLCFGVQHFGYRLLQASRYDYAENIISFTPPPCSRQVARVWMKSTPLRAPNLV